MADSSSGSVACSDKWTCTDTVLRYLSSHKLDFYFYSCENRFFEGSFLADFMHFSCMETLIVCEHKWVTTEVLSNWEVCMRRLYVSLRWLPPVLHFPESLNFTKGFLTHHDGLVPVVARWCYNSFYLLNSCAPNINFVSMATIQRSKYTLYLPFDCTLHKK